MRRWVAAQLRQVPQDGVLKADIVRNAALSFPVSIGAVKRFIDEFYVKTGMMEEDNGVIKPTKD